MVRDHRQTGPGALSEVRDAHQLRPDDVALGTRQAGPEEPTREAGRGDAEPLGDRATGARPRSEDHVEERHEPVRRRRRGPLGGVIGAGGEVRDDRSHGGAEEARRETVGGERPAQRRPSWRRSHIGDAADACVAEQERSREDLRRVPVVDQPDHGVDRHRADEGAQRWQIGARRQPRGDDHPLGAASRDRLMHAAEGCAVDRHEVPRMPGATGLDVLRVVKEVAPDTEVVIASGFAELDYAIECVRGGAFDFIQKPFDLAHLTAAVDRALEHRWLRGAAALLDASRAIFASQEPQRLPEVIVTVAMQIMGADDVSLMLPDGEGGLYIAYSHGLTPELTAAVHLALGERIAGRAAAAAEPFLIASDIGTDPRFRDIPSFGRVASSIVYPLLTAGRLVGVLNISRGAGSLPYHKPDLARASVLASQILLALENARLVRQMLMADRLASVGLLVAGAAHEISNPATSLVANQAYATEQVSALVQLGSLLDAADDPALRAAWTGYGGAAALGELRGTLDSLGHAAERIRDIAQDMRLLAHRDDGTKAVFDVNDAIRSALRIAGAELRRRTAVQTHLGEGLLVTGSPGRMSQVLINLLVNAAQAFDGSEESDHLVQITSARLGDRVTIEVADNGPGIRDEHLARVFETFFTTKEPGTGTGLGLAISRDIVRQHGGELAVRSRFGHGATFAISLPAAPGDAAAEVETPPGIAPTSRPPDVWLEGQRRRSRARGEQTRRRIRHGLRATSRCT